MSSSLSVRESTGEQLQNPRVVFGTRCPISAIFYGAVHAVVRSAGLHRGSGIKPILQDGRVLYHDYFLSNSGKDLIADRLRNGIKSAVYACEDTSFAVVPGFQEWVAPTDYPIDVLGSVAVTASYLSFNVFTLPSPDSDPSIHKYYDLAGTPAET